MTIFLILIIVFCFSLIGYKLASYYINRKKFFSSFFVLTGKIQTEIAFSKEKIAKVIQNNISFLQSSDLKVLCKNVIVKLENKQKIDSSICDTISVLKKEEKEFVVNFFSNLGRYDVVTESNEINLYRTKANEYMEQSNEECKKYSSLFIKLGIIVGLLVCLLIL